MALYSRVMLRWICPECGGEWPRSNTDCPKCAPSETGPNPEMALTPEVMPPGEVSDEDLSIQRALAIFPIHTLDTEQAEVLVPTADAKLSRGSSCTYW